MLRGEVMDIDLIIRIATLVYVLLTCIFCTWTVYDTSKRIKKIEKDMKEDVKSKERVS